MAWAAIDPNDGQPMLAIGADKAEHHLCLEIPGCNYRKSDDIWRVPLTWPAYVCFRLAWEHAPIVIHPELLAWGDCAWADIQARYADRMAMDMMDADLGQDLVDIESDGLLKLRPDQRASVAWLVKYGRNGIMDPTGNGKTPIVIRALQVLARQYDAAVIEPPGGPFPALYIGNGSALFALRDKFRDWAPELRVEVVAGTATRRRQALETEADVYMIAWPNLRYHTRLASYGSIRLVRCPECGGPDAKITPARCEVHEKELNTRRWGTVIADEAHKMKDPKSKQTRAAWWMMHHAEFAWPMTGTLVTENAADPWGPMHGLYPLAFPSRSRYLDMFAVKDYAWHGGAEILGLRTDHEYAFHQIIQPYWRRVPRAVARGTDDTRYEPEFRYPEMTAAQARLYKQLARETMGWLDGQTVMPPNAVVNFGRLCQLASGMIEQYDAEDAQGFTKPAVRYVLPSHKIDDLLEFLEDNPGPLVVAANSPSLVELAERKLSQAKITTAKIVGGMSAERAYDVNRWFQAGDVRVVFITAAGAESLDLQAASTIYFMQPDPSFRSREQKIGRVDRYGQPGKIRHVYAITRGTVDERLYQLGQEKEERHDSVARDVDLMRWMLEEVPVNWATGS